LTPDSEIYEKDKTTLFLQTVFNIPRRNKDDGVLGLNVDTRLIGGDKFSISGNILTGEHGRKFLTFTINDIDIWKLLLAQRPEEILDVEKQNGEYIPAVYYYIEIVKQLDLTQRMRQVHPRGLNRRAKYKLIKKATAAPPEGSGFLFSIQKPPFLQKKKIQKKKTQKAFKPSTVVIPSDKKGLMRALLQALAELRAGNTSMRNLVVPLAQEAKRKNILPPNLLSPDEETWVFV